MSSSVADTWELVRGISKFSFAKAFRLSREWINFCSACARQTVPGGQHRLKIPRRVRTSVCSRVQIAPGGRQEADKRVHNNQELCVDQGSAVQEARTMVICILLKSSTKTTAVLERCKQSVHAQVSLQKLISLFWHPLSQSFCPGMPDLLRNPPLPNVEPLRLPFLATSLSPPLATPICTTKRQT